MTIFDSTGGLNTRRPWDPHYPPAINLPAPPTGRPWGQPQPGCFPPPPVHPWNPLFPGGGFGQVPDWQRPVMWSR
jgi:hypothetical protein